MAFGRLATAVPAPQCAVLLRAIVPAAWFPAHASREIGPKARLVPLERQRKAKTHPPAPNCLLLLTCVLNILRAARSQAYIHRHRHATLWVRSGGVTETSKAASRRTPRPCGMVLALITLLKDSKPKHQ